MDSLGPFPTHQHPADWLALGCNPGSDRAEGSGSNLYIIASFSKTPPTSPSASEVFNLGLTVAEVAAQLSPSISIQ